MTVAVATTGPSDPARAALVRALVLLAGCAIVFRSELWWIARLAAREPEAAPALAAPVLIGLLWWRRRSLLAGSAGPGSAWGIVAIVVALLVLAAATWSSFGLPGRMAFLLACAGAVLVAAGWRTLWHATPLLLVALISVPLGPRTFALLTRAPEQVTLRAVRFGLELLPGVDLVELRGPDLHYLAEGVRGTIALGEPHRGAALLAASAVVVVFVAFARLRPAWQLAVFALATLPIVATCNVVRLGAWGVATVYGGAEATSAWPRLLAAAAALLTAWALAGFTGWILDKLLVTENT